MTDRGSGSTRQAPHRRRLDAVLFDLDGLTVDSEPFHLEAVRRALAEFDLPFEPDSIGPYYGRPARESIDRLAEIHGLDADQLYARRQAWFAELTRGGIPPMPGLHDAVVMLRRTGLRLGLVSSGIRANVERALSHLLREGVTFDAVVVREDVHKPKPDPEPFLLGAARLGAVPERCAVLEDAPPGIEAAHRAGMLAVAVPNAHTTSLTFDHADAVVPDLVAAARWLLEVECNEQTR